jgi:hypothetical protein
MFNKHSDNPNVVHLLASLTGWVIVTAITVKAINTSLDFAVAIGIVASAVLLSLTVYYLLRTFGWRPADELYPAQGDQAEEELEGNSAVEA